MNLTQEVQSTHSGHNGRSFAGDEAGGSKGGGWDGEVDRLVWAKKMDRGDTSPGGAEIECFRKLYKLRT